MDFSKEWLTPREVYREYGLSVSSLAKWRMDRKNLPFTKFGKYIKYKRSDIEKFMESHIREVAL